MCGRELEGIFSPSGMEWLLRQIHSNFTVCLKRNHKKCNDGRLHESRFFEFKNKGFKKQVKLDLSRHPDRFRNKLLKMASHDIFYLGYQMQTYHHMHVNEMQQGKPVDHAIHVRFTPESMKALGTNSRDYNAYRVKRLIAPAPALSLNSQADMNFRTNPNKTLTNYSTFDVENTSAVILGSAIKTPPQSISNDSIKLIRSSKDLKGSSADTVTSTTLILGKSTYNFTDIPNRNSKYHDQIDTSDEGKYETSATKTKPNPRLDQLNNTEIANDADYGKVRDSDLPIFRLVRKEKSTTTIMKSMENYAPGKVSARKVDLTNNVTEIPPQSSASALATGIGQVEETSDGGEIRERGHPVSRFPRKEGSTTNATMELANNHIVLGNISTGREAPSGLSSVSAALNTGIVQFENSSNGSIVRARGIPSLRTEKQVSSTAKITELSDSYAKDMLSENKGDLVSIAADKIPHSETVPQFEDTSEVTDNDYGKVKERRSRLVTNESSATTGPRIVDKGILQTYILRRNIDSGTTRNADYKSEDGEDYLTMYREGELDEHEEEYLLSTEDEGSSMRKSRASSQEFHPALILLTFIMRLFSAFSKRNC